MSNTATAKTEYIRLVLNGEVTTVDQARLQAEVDQLDSAGFATMVENFEKLYGMRIVDIAVKSRERGDLWAPFYKALAKRELQRYSN